MESPKDFATLLRAIEKLDGDVRNEMHSIMAMLELVAEEPLTELQFGRLRTCRSSADRLLRYVQNVCQFISPKTETPRLSPIDLQAVVTNTAGLMEELAQRKGLRFSAEILPGTPERVTGDRERIENILVRLLDNSIKFTDEGSIQLIVTTEQNNPESGRIEFIVSDSGPGIPEDTIARVLSPESPELNDNGLGLLIVHQLVRGMGGELSIGVQRGGGSRVTVSLPLQAADAPGSAEAGGMEHAQQQSPEPMRPLNILIAEDSDHSYFVIESYLEGQGHRLTRAQNGRIAVDRFKVGGYDLVLMDVHMPEMDGYAATQAIREWETTDGRARVPIVVLSSDSPDVQREFGAKAGCSGYITKPASKMVILNSLKRFTRTETQD